MRAQSWEDFEQELELASIGLGGSFASVAKKPAGMCKYTKTSEQPKSDNYEAPTQPAPKVLISEPPDEELGKNLRSRKTKFGKLLTLYAEKVYNGFMSLKMMRTKSTATLEDQTPSQRWQSLFRMFKEWRHHTTVAEARQMYQTLHFMIPITLSILSLNKENRALREEQIAKVVLTCHSFFTS